jgi:HlyD family secretion protein
MNKKTLTWISVASIVLVILLVTGKKMGWFGDSSNYQKVELADITPISIIETVAATGKIQPEVEVALSSEVSGEIIELPLKEGQTVEKGDLLVKINPDLIQAAVSQSQAGLDNVRAQLAQAKASENNAKLNYDRSKTLFEKGVISKSEWDNAVADYEMAQANRQAAYYNVQSAAASLKQARENLYRTTIYAPMSGTISKLSVELGERVVGTAQMAGTEIVRVANLKNMEVVVDVNENDIVKVAIGDSAKVEVDAYLGREFRGVVNEIANSAQGDLTSDQVTNFKVKVSILPDSYADLTEGKPESYSPFRPGMTATVDIITNRKERIVGVPISAIVVRSDTTGVDKSFLSEKNIKPGDRFEAVYVKEGDVAVLKPVTTGIQDETNIEIVSGLKEGETVITGPYTTVTKILKPGDKVQQADKN